MVTMTKQAPRTTTTTTLLLPQAVSSMLMATMLIMTMMMTSSDQQQQTMTVVMAQDTNCSSISEIACETEGFETLCELVAIAGLDDALDSGTWTVFAPTNEAFDMLGDDVISSLENNTDVLVDVLTYHAVVDEVLLSTDLNCTGPVAMANGKNSRTVCVDDDIFQKGIGNPRTDMPQILSVDIAACNGVVHVVSKVLLPFVVDVAPTDMPVTSPPVTDPPVDVPVESPSSSFPSDLPSLSPSVGGDEACATVTRIACETDATSTLCELIQQYGLDEALSEGLWTVFAPTNDAFSAIASVIPTLTPEQITDILLFHAVPDEELLSANLECSQLLTMANGDTSRTVCMDDMIYQRGPGNNQEGSTSSMWPEIIAADISACNGVIHLVSNVLLPKL